LGGRGEEIICKQGGWAVEKEGFSSHQSGLKEEFFGQEKAKVSRGGEGALVWGKRNRGKKLPALVIKRMRRKN